MLQSLFAYVEIKDWKYSPDLLSCHSLFLAQTLHVCMYKITCICVCACLSLHVFGMGVFNQVWPFITTVFFKSNRTLSVCMWMLSVFTAWRTCLNDNKNRIGTFENQLSECSQSVEFTLSLQSEVNRLDVVWVGSLQLKCSMLNWAQID